MGLMTGAVVGALSAVGTFIAVNSTAIIIGAAIGAAIGGISAAITGGSILKGVLFGAIGGAITGGIGAWAGGAGGAAGGTTAGAGQGMLLSAPAYSTGMAGAATAEGAIGAATVTTQGVTAGAAAAAGSGSTIAGTLAKFGGNLVEKFGGEAVTGIAKAYMSGAQIDKELSAKMTLANKELDGKLAILEKQAELAGDAQQSAPTAPDHALELADKASADRDKDRTENARQYDLTRKERVSAHDEIVDAGNLRKELFAPTGSSVSQSAEDANALGTVPGEGAVASAAQEAPATQNVLTEALPEEKLTALG